MDEFSANVHEKGSRVFLTVGHGIIRVGNVVQKSPEELWEADGGVLQLEANETSAEVVEPWRVTELPDPVAEDLTLRYRTVSNTAYVDATFENAPSTSFYVASGDDVYEVQRSMAKDKVEGDEFLGIEPQEEAFLLRNLRSGIAAPMDKQKVLDAIDNGDLTPVVRVRP